MTGTVAWTLQASAKWVFDCDYQNNKLGLIKQTDSALADQYLAIVATWTKL